MSKCHVHHRDILTMLKQKSSMNVLTIKTFYNARHEYRMIEQGGDLIYIICYIKFRNPITLDGIAGMNITPGNTCNSSTPT